MKVPKDLQLLWSKKLKASGFKDIESPYGDLKEDPFIRSMNEHTRAAYAVLGKKGALAQSQIRNLTRAQYYARAGEFLISHKFARGDLLLWTLHCEGVSYRKVAKAAKKKGYKNTSRMAIYRRIQRLKEKMVATWDIRPELHGRSDDNTDKARPKD